MWDFHEIVWYILVMWMACANKKIVHCTIPWKIWFQKHTMRKSSNPSCQVFKFSAPRLCHPLLSSAYKNHQHLCKPFMCDVATRWPTNWNQRRSKSTNSYTYVFIHPENKKFMATQLRNNWPQSSSHIFHTTFDVVHSRKAGTFYYLLHTIYSGKRTTECKCAKTSSILWAVLSTYNELSFL